MKAAYNYLFFFVALTACDTRSKYKKAADEMASELKTTTHMNAGKKPYTLYVPNGWTTAHQEAYGINYYFLRAPKTEDDPNTNMNVTTEDMQNLPLDEYRTKAIASMKTAVPSASNFEEGEITAHGLRGVWYSYTMAPQNIQAALVCYMFPKDGHAYIITAGTQTKDAVRYRALFDSVARSFKFSEFLPGEKH